MINILFAASEMAPFCKTGGLADVLGSLPAALAEIGHNVTVMIPGYSDIRRENYGFTKLKGTLLVSVGYERKPLELSVTRCNNMSVYLLENDEYFNRQGLYGDSKGDYADNAERFIFYSGSVFAASRFIGLRPDIIHAHDWQAGLTMAYHKTLFKKDKWFSDAASLFTIHNLGYQGVFPGEIFELTGLPPSEFSWTKLEYFKNISFIKGGIIYSDAVSTVSETYAVEITSPPLDFGLGSVLSQRMDHLFGIVNGIDTNEWNPAQDPEIPANYTPEKMEGKQICRKALSKECGFRDDGDPIAGMVTRIDSQKGFDILEESIDKLISMRLKIVILGSGTEESCLMILKLAERFPGLIKVFIKFDNTLAKLIYSGSDIFLMPSKYEPCGLGQLIAMRYGSIPLVHSTGGLADTVRDIDIFPDGNGFSFSEYSSESLVETSHRVVETFHQKSRKKWLGMMERAMKEDFSWSKSASRYVELYRRIGKNIQL